MLDKAKFGEALAKTMDRLEKMDECGHLEGYELDEVLVTAAFIRPTDVDEIENGMESLVFVDGTTQIPYVQVGVLTLALDTVARPIPEEGD